MRLNDQGRELYLKHYRISAADAVARLEAIRDEHSDHLRLQLHELMAVFGQHMTGLGSPFVDNEILFRRP